MQTVFLMENLYVLQGCTTKPIQNTLGRSKLGALTRMSLCGLIWGILSGGDINMNPKTRMSFTSIRAYEDV